MICQNCIHSEVCKHKTEAVYECEHFKDGTIKKWTNTDYELAEIADALNLEKAKERVNKC